MQALQENDLQSDDLQVFIRLYRDNWKNLYHSAYRVLKDRQPDLQIVGLPGKPASATPFFRSGGSNRLSKTKDGLTWYAMARPKP